MLLGLSSGGFGTFPTDVYLRAVELLVPRVSFDVADMKLPAGWRRSRASPLTIFRQRHQRISLYRAIAFVALEPLSAVNKRSQKRQARRDSALLKAAERAERRGLAQLLRQQLEKEKAQREDEAAYRRRQVIELPVRLKQVLEHYTTLR